RKFGGVAVHCCLRQSFLVLAILAVCHGGSASGQAPGGPLKDTKPPAPATTATQNVLAALDRLDAFLGNNANADRWREYLQTDQLRLQLAKGAEAAPSAISQGLQHLSGSANGLNLPQFVALRQSVQAWLAELRSHYADDIAQLAWSYSRDFAPITPEQFAAVRADMRTKAQMLMQFLGRNSTLAKGWR